MPVVAPSISRDSSAALPGLRERLFEVRGDQQRGPGEGRDQILRYTNASPSSSRLHGNARCMSSESVVLGLARWISPAAFMGWTPRICADRGASGTGRPGCAGQAAEAIHDHVSEGFALVGRRIRLAQAWRASFSCQRIHKVPPERLSWLQANLVPFSQRVHQDLEHDQGTRPQRVDPPAMRSAKPMSAVAVVILRLRVPAKARAYDTPRPSSTARPGPDARPAADR